MTQITYINRTKRSSDEKVVSRYFLTIALIALCAAYLQAAIVRLFDFQGAVTEMARFGFSPAPLMAAIIIGFQLVASAMVVLGWLRWIGAAILSTFTLLATSLAYRFWELPPGGERLAATSAFFEHIGLVGAFLLVAWYDISQRARSSKW